MIRHIGVVLFALILSPAWGQDSYQTLVKAFKSDSIPLLEEFLNKWNKISIPITNLDELSVIEKNTYAIYLDFFNPFSLDRYGKHEWGNDLYSDIKYVIIQTSIQTIVLKTDSIDKDYRNYPDSIINQKIDISDFKPNLIFDSVKVLYLTSEYAGYFDKFLKKKHYKLGTGGIMNPARAKGNAVLKQEFLNQRLLVLHGHWGGYWHLETHPQIGNIIFNRDLTQAKINFRIAYQGGEAYYLKKDDGWIIKSSEITWIE